MLWFAVLTGMRRRETCNLEWRGVDRESGLLLVRKSKTHNQQPAARPHLEAPGTDPRPARAVRHRPRDVVLRNGRGGPISYHSIAKKFRHYREEAKLSEDVTFHALRHTYASWLVQRGVQLKIVQEALGHKKIESTMVYAHLQPVHVKRAVSKALDGEFVAA